MPLVAIRASVSEVLPWSYFLRSFSRLFGNSNLRHEREYRSDGLDQRASCRFCRIDSTYIPDFICIALQCDELFWTHNGHGGDNVVYSSCFGMKMEIHVRKLSISHIRIDEVFTMGFGNSSATSEEFRKLCHHHQSTTQP